MINFSLY